ncbi:MAG: hypothetical protein JKY49_06180 [Cohaesibacteraceae bacterium]|nr:hypothetical protein [Cohaesibacteraceae bacterium]
MKTGRRIQRFFGHSDIISTIAVLPDNRFLVTGSWDKTARIWPMPD